MTGCFQALDPEGALHICRTLVQGSADRTHRQGYEEAIGWLKRMAALHRKQGSQQEFADYLKSPRKPTAPSAASLRCWRSG